MLVVRTQLNNGIWTDRESEFEGSIKSGSAGNKKNKILNKQSVMSKSINFSVKSKQFCKFM